MAKRVSQDFQSGSITNLHPQYINDRKRKYFSSEMDSLASEFWSKDGTIPEPSYRKVRYLSLKIAYLRDYLVKMKMKIFTVRENEKFASNKCL